MGEDGPIGPTDNQRLYSTVHLETRDVRIPWQPNEEVFRLEYVISRNGQHRLSVPRNVPMVLLVLDELHDYVKTLKAELRSGIMRP